MFGGDELGGCVGCVVRGELIGVCGVYRVKEDRELVVTLAVRLAGLGGSLELTDDAGVALVEDVV